MTILQASFVYGTKTTTASVNESLTTIVARLYQDYSDIYYQVLETLNPRFDWTNIIPGAEIRYLPKEVCGELYEITAEK